MGSISWGELLKVFVALGGIGGLVAVMNYLAEHKERRKKARIEEIKEAVRPIIEADKEVNRQRHEENRDNIHSIQLVQKEMFVKVEDLWERRKKYRQENGHDNPDS